MSSYSFMRTFKQLFSFNVSNEIKKTVISVSNMRSQLYGGMEKVDKMQTNG